MNRNTFFTIAAVLLAGAAFLNTKSHAADFPKGSPQFTANYAAALKAGQDTGKPVVLIFSAVWCPPCQANKRNVYPSDAVKPFHDKFVWAYLDADDKDNVTAMQKYGVTGIPHIQFLDKEGKPLDTAVGGTSPEEFAKTLGATLKKSGS